MSRKRQRTEDSFQSYLVSKTSCNLATAKRHVSAIRKLRQEKFKEQNCAWKEEDLAEERLDDPMFWTNKQAKRLEWTKDQAIATTAYFCDETNPDASIRNTIRYLESRLRTSDPVTNEHSIRTTLRHYKSFKKSCESRVNEATNWLRTRICEDQVLKNMRIQNPKAPANDINKHRYINLLERNGRDCAIYNVMVYRPKGKPRNAGDSIKKRLDEFACLLRDPDMKFPTGFDPIEGHIRKIGVWIGSSCDKSIWENCPREFAEKGIEYLWIDDRDLKFRLLV